MDDSLNVVCVCVVCVCVCLRGWLDKVGELPSTQGTRSENTSKHCCGFPPAPQTSEKINL